MKGSALCIDSFFLNKKDVSLSQRNAVREAAERKMRQKTEKGQ